MKTKQSTTYISAATTRRIRVYHPRTSAALTVIITSCFLLISELTNAQLTVGVKGGVSPSVSPGTAYRIVNRNDPVNEFLFNSRQVQYTPAVGLLARLDKHPFWFSAEAVAYGTSETYSIQYCTDKRTAQGTDHENYFELNEKTYFVELPLSVGVTLGRIEVFSGFSPKQVVSQTTELDQIPGYSSDLPKRYMAWHSGIGINLHNVLIDIKYTQAFANYGQHRYVNGEELTLGNSPRRVTASLAFRF